MTKETIIPIFPLNGVIFFPGTELPLNIFEKRYINMIDFSLSHDKKIGMVQIQPSGEIYNKGCVGKIISYNETIDGRYTITLKGENIFTNIEEKNYKKNFRVIKAKIFDTFVNEKIKINFKKDIFINKYLKLINQNQSNINLEIINSIEKTLLIKFVAMSCPFEIVEKQMLLEAKNLQHLLEMTDSLLDLYNNQINENSSIN